MIASPHFVPIPLAGYNTRADKLPSGRQVLWGIPFSFAEEGERFELCGGEAGLSFEPALARWLVFAHSAELPQPEAAADGLYRGFRGMSPLMEPVCDYIIRYADGQESVIPIRNRMEIGKADGSHVWAYNAFLCVPSERARAIHTASEDILAGRAPDGQYFRTMHRAVSAGGCAPWLYAWENPRPDAFITGITVRHRKGQFRLLGVTSGQTRAHPLRYGRRRKAIVSIPGVHTDLLDAVEIDLGHIISVLPQTGRNGTYIVEYNAHEDAVLYVEGEPAALTPIPPAEQSVTLTVLGPEGAPVPCRIRAYGASGEYLPPRGRHRIPNPHWFEDYALDCIQGDQWHTYIDGTDEYLLPLGEVCVEVSKGFEYRHQCVKTAITPETASITLQLERALDWRSRGWVTADTHVHFLSPGSALLQAEAEDIHVVHVLATQFAESFTNVGDFLGNREIRSGTGHIARVGTENRQRMLGHISLLGYEGGMILPLCAGGPIESAIGDPVDTTLTQWARQCRKQNGLSILPHFPKPQAEGAAAIISGAIDAVEMTPGDGLGIHPYGVSDWYRYLNCGYHVPVVGGTDKMNAAVAVGAMRTYANINGPLTFQSWKEAVRSGRTFVSYGALADFTVNGYVPGETLALRSGETLDVCWTVASADIPITRVELVRNGETAETVHLDGYTGERDGEFHANMEESGWLALRVRGHIPGKPEIIIAHTSAVMITVGGHAPFNLADAAAILYQIRGAIAHVETLATQAREAEHTAALAALASAERELSGRIAAFPAL
jgi:hypothetical protein